MGLEPGHSVWILSLPFELKPGWSRITCVKLFFIISYTTLALFETSQWIDYNVKFPPMSALRSAYRLEYFFLNDKHGFTIQSRLSLG